MSFQKLSEAVEGKSRWKVVPQSRTGGRETPISEFVMCSRHEQLPRVIGVGAQWATTNVRQKATVVCEVRGSRSNERLVSKSAKSASLQTDDFGQRYALFLCSPTCCLAPAPLTLRPYGAVQICLLLLRTRSGACRCWIGLFSAAVPASVERRQVA